MIRKIGRITSSDSPKRELTQQEMWNRMEQLGWLNESPRWIELTLFSGSGAISSQVRSTRFLSLENQLLFEGVHSIVQMPVPLVAKGIAELERPQSRYSHEFWFLWPDDSVWILGQLKKRPKFHERVRRFGSGLIEVSGKTFGPDDSIDLDDCRFVGCHFDRCKVQYAGGEVSFEECEFDNPHLTLAGEAANTARMLNVFDAFASGPFRVQTNQ
ncbi:MAG TPA: hypothetical protein VN380_14430 [Thermoanaerobaculia bacterium]|jgi:hypothetical protein|nr:hypothetical protein [Thermoanaerobaculia bacterium]